jgi:hypothetical protein
MLLGILMSSMICDVTSRQPASNVHQHSTTCCLLLLLLLLLPRRLWSTAGTSWRSQMMSHMRARCWKGATAAECVLLSLLQAAAVLIAACFLLHLLTLLLLLLLVLLYITLQLCAA